MYTQLTILSIAVTNFNLATKNEKDVAILIYMDVTCTDKRSSERSSAIFL